MELDKLVGFDQRKKKRQISWLAKKKKKGNRQVFVINNKIFKKTSAALKQLGIDLPIKIEHVSRSLDPRCFSIVV